MNLDEVPEGVEVVVLGLDLEDEQRRRLMELGLVRGTRVRAVMGSPLLDPTAYEVRGAVIALRRCHTAGIRVEVA